MSEPDAQGTIRPGGPNFGLTLVTGATGFIGRRLVDEFCRAGKRVRVLSRSPGDVPSHWAGLVQVAQGDVTEPASLAAAAHGCSLVAHLAAEWRAPAQCWSVNVLGTDNLLRAAHRAGVGHVLHMSSVGVMGCRRSGRIDEAESCHPTNEYERSKLEAERIALRWSSETGTTVTVLRPTIVFGPRLSGADSLLELLRAIRARRFVHLDTGAVANYVYVEDVVRACLRALECRASGTFIVADPCRLTEFVAKAADALQVPRPAYRVPLSVAYAAAATAQVVAWLVHRASPLTVARVRALSSKTWFESSLITGALGWTPGVGWAVGLQRTVDAYRAARQL